jgi:hypothetical protein
MDLVRIGQHRFLGGLVDIRSGFGLVLVVDLLTGRAGPLGEGPGRN